MRTTSSTTTRLRYGVAAAAVAAGVIAPAVYALPAQAAGTTSVSKLELKGTQLRVEGTTAGAGLVVVDSTVSSASGFSGQGGLFKIQSSSFSAPDCYVTVRGVNAPNLTVRIPGCTPSVTPAPASPAAPSGTCTIDPVPARSLAVNTFAAIQMSTTGCDRSQSNVMRWKLVAGAVPTGMSGPDAQGQGFGSVSGTPSVPGTYRFTVQVTDDFGQTDQETVTATVS